MDYEDVIYALNDIAKYNGQTENVKNIQDYIKQTKDRQVLYPHFLPNDIDNFLRTIWSMLVIMFGDYGTSPRFGWVEKKKEAIDFLDRICNEYKDG